METREAIEREIRAACDATAYKRAATLLLKIYGRELLGFLVSRLRDADAGGEVFSDLCEDLWRGLPAFAWRCSARVWAYTLARHAASRYLKVAQRRRRGRVPLSHASQLSELQDRIRSETLPMLKSEVKSRMAALREQLPADDQALLLLRVNRGLDWKEIALIMLDEPADDARVAREAARLRKRLQLVKERLQQLARAEGLLEQHPTSQ